MNAEYVVPDQRAAAAALLAVRADGDPEALQALLAYLEGMPHRQLAHVAAQLAVEWAFANAPVNPEWLQAVVYEAAYAEADR